MSEQTTGQIIAGRYKVTGFLRPGRMGDLYLARRDDGTVVILKLLDPNLFDNDEAVRRFQREAQVTQQIVHPCSMQVLDVGTSERGPYLALEYVEGELLSDVIEEAERLAPERAASIAGYIALALDAAHTAGVVHRDLAPENVLVVQSAGGEFVKVSDFGLSSIQDQSAEETNLTAVGVRIGTPYYMAPEYIEEYELDYRADIYGLGVMLYEMVVGEPPYVGRPYKVMDQHVNAPIPKASAKVSNVPAWLDDLIAKLMAKSPSDRPQSAHLAVQAIQRALGRKLEVPKARQAPAPAPAPLPSAQPSSGGDPLLQKFIRDHIESIETSAAPQPNPSACWVVTQVADTCIAAAAGVVVGSLMQLPEEQHEGLLTLRIHHQVVNRRTYHFYPPGGDARITLKASGIPIGIEVARTPHNVVSHYDPLVPDATALLDLWRQRSFKELEDLSWRTLLQQKGTQGLLNTGRLFARFLGSDKPKLFDHPALVLYGAALVEKGDLKAAGPYLSDFHVKYSQHWHPVYTAIACLYLAKLKEKAGNAQAAAELLHQAWAHAPTPEVARMIQDIARHAPPAPSLQGKEFPEYSLDTPDESASAKLSSTLRQLDASELHVVCMMGGFRGNLQYDDFMQRYTCYAAFFQPFLAHLHVISTATERDHDKPEHYLGEDLALMSRVPMMLLQDYRAFVQRAVKPTQIPTIYLLDHTGTCVHQGQLSSVELWDALKLAGEHRMKRLGGG